MVSMRGSVVASLLTVLMGIAGCVTLSSPRELTLVKDGRSVATIIVAETPTKAAQLAAFEIQEHVRIITGAVLPIVKEGGATTGVKLFVGASKAAAAAGAPVDFKDQEYAVQFTSDSIMILGKDKEDFGEVRYWHSGEPKIDGAYDYPTWPDLFDAKGSLHAAYDFLEEYCGVRWFDQSEFGTDAPQTHTLTVAARDLRRTPTFRYRDPGYLRDNMELYDREVSLWTIRWSESTPKFQEWLDLIYEKGRKLPACAHPHRWLAYERSHVFAFLTRRKLGGEPFKTNHSFYDYYDRFWEKNPKQPEAFVERHADWFAQGYPDDKVPPQMCYSNPEVAAQCLADARTFFALPEEERRRSRLGTDKFWPVVPMDNSSYCKCPRCAARFADAERVHPDFSNGDHSERVWSFVNQIAKGLRQSNPDKMVSALAYSTYAYRPAGMQIEDNIAVQMCLFPQFAAVSPDGLKKDDMILHQWADGRPLYLWLYAGLTTGHKTAVPVFPKPMGDLYGPLLQKYQKAGVRGIFFNGVPQETDAYLLFKLTDDPNQDTEKLVDDYFIRMYGSKAGEHMKQFYRLVEEIYANPRNYPAGAKGPELDWGILGTGPRMARLEALVNEAEKELAAAPELWRKRFSMFKLGTWDYMKEGRAKYLESKVAKAAASVAVSCPHTFGQAPGGDLDKVDWRDAQGFGGFNGWLRDNGDLSLRKITGAMTHDGTWLYLTLTEEALDRKPGAGDSWELLLMDKPTATAYRLFIDPSGSVTTQTSRDGGAPQEWRGHGAKATSKVEGQRGETLLALPIPTKLLDKQGGLFMNCRRNDAAGEDSPVLVATAGDFESGKTGATVYFDKAMTMPATAPTNQNLIMHWDFSGTGEKVVDRSGRGNDGILVGAATRGADGVEFTGGGQYVEAAALKGRIPEKYTLSCWLNYSDANRQGGLRIFTLDSLRATIAVPHQKILINWNDVNGKVTGRGPGGVELTPRQWHMLCLVNDGETITVYENGRSRFSFKAKEVQAPSPDAVLRFGGEPKLPSWQTFLGTLTRIQLFDRALTPEEIRANYQAEYPEYRKK